MLRHRLHRFPASPSAIHELLPLISCSSGRAAGDLVGCLLSLSASPPTHAAQEPLTAPVQPNHRARHTDSTAAAHPAQSRQLISLVFTSPWRACNMHTRINQPSNGPSHGAKRTPTIRPTPKPPSHCVYTHHTPTSRLPPVPRKLPSLFCAHIRATCNCPLLTCRVG